MSNNTDRIYLLLHGKLIYLVLGRVRERERGVLIQIGFGKDQKKRKSLRVGNALFSREIREIVYFPRYIPNASRQRMLSYLVEKEKKTEIVRPLHYYSGGTVSLCSLLVTN